MNVKKSLQYLLTVSIFVAFLGHAMSLGDFGKLCLFSGISGVITLNGEPVKNAIVKRQASKVHTQGYKRDETTTDENGYFEMPPLYDRSIVGKFLPMEFVSSQTIVVSYQGQEYDLWIGIKRSPEENAEARGKPLNVTCALDQELNHIRVDGTFYDSRCVWDVESDPVEDIWGPPIPDDDI